MAFFNSYAAMLVITKGYLVGLWHCAPDNKRRHRDPWRRHHMSWVCHRVTLLYPSHAERCGGRGEVHQRNSHGVYPRDPSGRKNFRV